MTHCLFLLQRPVQYNYEATYKATNRAQVHSEVYFIVPVYFVVVSIATTYLTQERDTTHDCKIG